MSATGRSDIREQDDFYETQAWVVDLILPHLTTLPCAPPHDLEKRRRRILLEPTCGRGAILERLHAHGVPKERMMGIELHTGRALACTERGFRANNWDFLAWADHVLKRNEQIGMFSPFASLADLPTEFDCVISNPPFNIAIEVIRSSLALVKAKGGEVAMLLRLGFMAGQERVDFHKENPSDIFVLPRRPSFCASISCKAKGCGWKVRLPLDAPRPARCEACENDVAVSTSDSSDYGWFVWGPGRGHRWRILDRSAEGMTPPGIHDRSAEV